MAKRKGRTSLVFGPSTRQVTWMLGVFLVLVAGIMTTMLAVSRQTLTPPRASTSCTFDNCNQCRDHLTGAWIILNASCPGGDLQACTMVKYGACGGQKYCCPAPGGQWTTNLSACSGQPAYSCQGPITPTPTPQPTATPTPTPTPEPTDTPTPTPTPVPQTTYYYVQSTPTDTPTPTPTPTSYILNSCNKACSANADCPGGLTCATAFGQQVCRNPLCADQFSCLCNQGSFANLVLTPTPTESSLGSGQQVALSVSTFTDSNGLASSQPTITGLTEPGASITVSIFPDGVSGTVIADASGRWSWRATKTLTPGQKSLLVVAKNASGAQGQVNQTFTVAQGGSGNPWGILLLFLILAGVGFGGYVYYKSNNP